MNSYDTLFIGGRWISPRGNATFQTINPSTEEVLAEVAAASAEDVDLAVKTARKAFDNGPWRSWTGAHRAAALMTIAGGIRKARERLARLLVQDNGKPLIEAQGDIDDSAGCFEYYANLARDLDDTSDVPREVSDKRFSCVVRKESVGVAAAITPWNYPLLMESWKVAPALAAGCSVVLKPSELAPLMSLELANIVSKTDLPAGVLNVITGSGPKAGAALASHPMIDKLAFTGSGSTGRSVSNAAMEGVKNVTLELGGKSPLIIFDDSDLIKAVEWAMFGVFWNQGEVCSATSRVLVQETVYEKFLKTLTDKISSIHIGNGLDSGINMGPIISSTQYDRVNEAIARGVAEGARLVTGGKRPGHLPRGFFIEPTVFADVPKHSWIWREEIFGPVMCVQSFCDECDAVAEANNSRFGLAGAVISGSPERCSRVAKALRAGIVWVNCSQPTFTEAPWGGYKQSGNGRELGEWGLDNYLEVKQITSFDSGERWGWYAM